MFKLRSKSQANQPSLNTTFPCTSGMSLLEITVVLFIVALIFSISLPAFRITKKTALETAALDIQLKIQGQRDIALEQGKQFFFRIFPERKEIRLYAGTPEVVFANVKNLDTVESLHTYTFPKGVFFKQISYTNVSQTTGTHLFDKGTAFTEVTYDIQIDDIGIIDLFNLTLSQQKKTITIHVDNWLGHVLVSKLKTQ